VGSSHAGEIAFPGYDKNLIYCITAFRSHRLICARDPHCFVITTDLVWSDSLECLLKPDSVAK